MKRIGQYKKLLLVNLSILMAVFGLNATISSYAGNCANGATKETCACSDCDFEACPVNMTQDPYNPSDYYCATCMNMCGADPEECSCTCKPCLHSSCQVCGVHSKCDCSTCSCDRCGKCPGSNCKTCNCDICPVLSCKECTTHYSYKCDCEECDCNYCSNLVDGGGICNLGDCDGTGEDCPIDTHSCGCVCNCSDEEPPEGQ